MKYQVTLTAVIRHVIEVEARSENDAEAKAMWEIKADDEMCCSNFLDNLVETVVRKEGNYLEEGDVVR